MTSMPWIKLYTELLDDPKLGRLPDGTKWRFVQLCLLAGECDAEGYLVNGIDPLTDADIAWRLRIDEKELSQDIAQLVKLDLIEFDEGEFRAWFIVNFSKRQGRSQSEKRRAWRERKRRQREQEQDTNGTDEDVTRDNSVNHAGVTALEESRGEESRGEERKDKRGGKNQPPTPTQSQAMFTALANAYRIDLKTITKAQRGRLNAESKRLLDADKTTADVQAADTHWWNEDWRGKDKRSPPTSSQFFQTIEIVRQSAVQDAIPEAQPWQ